MIFTSSSAGAMWHVLVLCAWLGVLLGTASPSTSNILSSLSELDFHRIRADHASSSIPPTLSLTRQMIGAGYHRELRVNIKIRDLGGYSNNKVLLIENITRDMYMDLDQVCTDLRARSGACDHTHFPLATPRTWQCMMTAGCVLPCFSGCLKFVTSTPHVVITAQCFLLQSRIVQTVWLVRLHVSSACQQG